jgi:hypothetical protein
MQNNLATHISFSDLTSSIDFSTLSIPANVPSVMTRSIVSLALVLLSILWAQGAAAQPLTITGTVSTYSGAGANGPAGLVSNSIPFKPGALSDARNVRVLSGAVEVPVAARVLATWPADGSIRALLLQFDASPGTYTIQVGTARTTSDRALIPVTWDVPTRLLTLPALHLSDSLVFGEQKPLGASGFPDWDQKQVADYGRISTVGTAVCVRDDHYYDAITTTYQMYARTGNVTYLANARRWALHHRRDQIYLSGTSIGHPRCTGGYLNNTRYTFPQGLVQDYFMFGDDADVSASRTVVDNFYMAPSFSWWFYKAPNARGFWTEREPAFALMGVLALYEATGEQRYLDFADTSITSLHRMQVDNGRRAWVHSLYDHDPDEGCDEADFGSSPWMSGLLLEAIIKYHRITNDPMARDSILMAVDDLRARYLATGDYANESFVYLGCSAYSDGTPDLDNLIAHAYGYAYRLTGTQSYRTLGTALFNTSVADGSTFSHKHFNQQFRSSGYYPAYISSGPAVVPSPPTGLTAQ